MRESKGWRGVVFQPHVYFVSVVMKISIFNGRVLCIISQVYHYLAKEEGKLIVLKFYSYNTQLENSKIIV